MFSNPLVLHKEKAGGLGGAAAPREKSCPGHQSEGEVIPNNS